MPAKHLEPGSPGEWLARAKGDLALARQPLPEDAFYEDLCFHAQQAAEKAIKAVLIHLKTPFPKTHNLEAVMDLLPDGFPLPPAIRQSAALTHFATTTRYSFDEPAVTQEEHREAVAMAQTVVKWAEGIIAGAKQP
jgi:HEPN domain-containing protein